MRHKNKRFKVMKTIPERIKSIKLCRLSQLHADLIEVPPPSPFETQNSENSQKRKDLTLLIKEGGIFFDSLCEKKLEEKLVDDGTNQNLTNDRTNHNLTGDRTFHGLTVTEDNSTNKFTEKKEIIDDKEGRLLTFIVTRVFEKSSWI